jgi:hypothetical protein
MSLRASAAASKAAGARPRRDPANSAAAAAAAPPSSDLVLSAAERATNHRYLFRLVFPAALLLRVALSFLLHATGWYSIVASRLELTNALVSWRGVKESLAHSNWQATAGDATSSALFTPYSGLTSSRAPPILLWIAQAFLHLPSNAAETPSGADAFFEPTHLAVLVAFALMDVLTGYAIARLTAEAYSLYPSVYVPRQVAQQFATEHVRLPVIAAAVYLLNPFSIASCAILNLSSLNQLVLSWCLLAALRGRVLAAMVLLGVSTYLEMYPILVFVPVVLMLHRARYSRQAGKGAYEQYRYDQFIDHDACKFVGDSDNASTDTASSSSASIHPLSASSSATDDLSCARSQLSSSGFHPLRILKVIYRPIPLPVEEDEVYLTKEVDDAIDKSQSKSKWNVVLILTASVLFLTTLALLLAFSWSISSQSWSFLRDSYGYSFHLSSLNPTYSLFWYFFTSIFDRFTSFFLVIFHAHILVYLVPMWVRFDREPVFLATLTLHLTTVFKPYPLLSDLFFTGVLLLLVNVPLIRLTLRRLYPTVFLNAVSLLTLTLMQYLWLQSGSGNANFFFFQNLLYLFTQLFTCMETIGAVRRLQATMMEGRVGETNTRRKEAIQRDAPKKTR